MTTSINVTDLGKLAKLSCAVVHSIDFPELGESGNAKQALLGEVDRLDQQYANNAMLFDLRAAVCSFPVRKQTVYSLTHDILCKVRGSRTKPIRPHNSSVATSIASMVNINTPPTVALHS